VIFAASAKTAATFAAKGTLFAGATSLVTRGMETGWDTDAMKESAALAASEGFKWGAISGAVAGGAKKGLDIHKDSKIKIPSGSEAEERALKKYGGRKQVSYLNREEVPDHVLGSTRPDIVLGNEAIEVKCYDLTNKGSLKDLRTALIKQVSQRVDNLPEGMTQRIVLNVEGREYSTAGVNQVVDWIRDFLDPIYPDIPIDIMGATI